MEFPKIDTHKDTPLHHLLLFFLIKIFSSFFSTLYKYQTQTLVWKHNTIPHTPLQLFNACQTKHTLQTSNHCHGRRSGKSESRDVRRRRKRSPRRRFQREQGLRGDGRGNGGSRQRRGG